MFCVPDIFMFGLISLFDYLPRKRKQLLLSARVVTRSGVASCYHFSFSVVTSVLKMIMLSKK